MGRLFPLVCFIFVSGSEIVADVGDPLFLTPYIINGQITEAKELSRVQNLTASFLEPMSYSGFITVNATHNANLFFWFFPAQVIISVPFQAWLFSFDRGTAWIPRVQLQPKIQISYFHFFRVSLMTLQLFYGVKVSHFI